MVVLIPGQEISRLPSLYLGTFQFIHGSPDSFGANAKLDSDSGHILVTDRANREQRPQLRGDARRSCWVSHQSAIILEPIRSIFDRSPICQIPNPIVGRIIVQVSNLGAIKRTRPNERESYDRMNGMQPAAKSNLQMPVSIRGLLQNLLFELMPRNAYRSKTLHPSQVRYLICALITWHFFPNFSHVYLPKNRDHGTAEPGPLGCAS